MQNCMCLRPAYQGIYYVTHKSTDTDKHLLVEDFGFQAGSGGVFGFTDVCQSLVFLFALSLALAFALCPLGFVVLGL